MVPGLSLTEYDPVKVLGYPDCLKVRSCMTLFHVVRPDEKIFSIVIDKYYDGIPDEMTIKLLKL